MNDFEIAARLAKAERIRDLLVFRGLTSNSVGLLPRMCWIEAARTSGAAGKNGDRVPSQETRNLVVSLMRDGERESLRVSA